MKSPIRTSVRPWFFLTVALSCLTLLALVFSLWELVEHRYFRDLDYVTLHHLYITRGVTSSLLVGMWASWLVLRERRRREAQLQQSCEHYRTILDHMPEAVILFDEHFRVEEWNEAAERLYGLQRQQVLREVLPTVPGERWSELQEVVALVARAEKSFARHGTLRAQSADRGPGRPRGSRFPFRERRRRILVHARGGRAG